MADNKINNIISEKRDLKVIHGGQKSFYKKAIVIETRETDGIQGKIELYSYDTLVATVTYGEVLVLYVDDMYSRTTKRHIKEFILQQFGLKTWLEVDATHKLGQKIWVLS